MLTPIAGIYQYAVLGIRETATIDFESSKLRSHGGDIHITPLRVEVDYDLRNARVGINLSNLSYGVLNPRQATDFVPSPVNRCIIHYRLGDSGESAQELKLFLGQTSYDIFAGAYENQDVNFYVEGLSNAGQVVAISEQYSCRMWGLPEVAQGGEIKSSVQCGADCTSLHLLPFPPFGGPNVSLYHQIPGDRSGWYYGVNWYDEQPHLVSIDYKISEWEIPADPPGSTQYIISPQDLTESEMAEYAEGSSDKVNVSYDSLTGCMVYRPNSQLEFCKKAKVMSLAPIAIPPASRFFEGWINESKENGVRPNSMKMEICFDNVDYIYQNNVQLEFNPSAFYIGNYNGTVHPRYTGKSWYVVKNAYSEWRKYDPIDLFSKPLEKIDEVTDDTPSPCSDVTPTFQGFTVDPEEEVSEVIYQIESIFTNSLGIRKTMKGIVSFSGLSSTMYCLADKDNLELTGKIVKVPQCVTCTDEYLSGLELPDRFHYLIDEDGAWHLVELSAESPNPLDELSENSSLRNSYEYFQGYSVIVSTQPKVVETVEFIEDEIVEEIQEFDSQTSCEEALLLDGEREIEERLYLNGCLKPTTTKAPPTTTTTTTTTDNNYYDHEHNNNLLLRCLQQ